MRKRKLELVLKKNEREEEAGKRKYYSCLLQFEKFIKSIEENDSALTEKA